MNADGSDVTLLLRDATFPALSPDGQRIAFTRLREQSIFVASVEGSNEARLTDGRFLSIWPAWSPDGERIAFESYADGLAEVHVMNADGSGDTRLTHTRPGLQSRHPAWSPDGERIAFASNGEFNGRFYSDIYVINADGSGQVNLTDSEAEDHTPAWSPDGTRIAFTSDRDGNTDIYIMNVDGSGLTRLTDHPALDAIGTTAWQPRP
jgi:Tol biopolymer transport system component